MFYDRKIKYFDYMENNQRLGCGGFVKMEAREDSCNIILQISGLHATDNNMRKVYVLGENRKELLCEIPLNQGKGNIRLSLKCNNVCGGISYTQIKEIQIPVSPGRELLCMIVSQRDCKPVEKVENQETRAESKIITSEERKNLEKEEQNIIPGKDPSIIEKEEQNIIPRKDPSIIEKGEQNIILREDPSVIAKEEQNIIPREDPSIIVKEEQTIIPKREPKREPKRIVQEEVKIIENQVFEEEKKKESNEKNQDESKVVDGEAQKIAIPLAEDKWKQLWAIYPHFAPFQDDREYLSVGLSDFVILQQKYYKLVNNSFLLHGFYNYKHLLLTRVEARGERRYYIGVPGNFYEREKQVALMFGFESFEGREEPANSGDFGYYMIPVEI